jgi:heme exporter protein C
MASSNAHTRAPGTAGNGAGRSAFAGGLVGPFEVVWILALAAMLTALSYVFFVAPQEQIMGVVQKIFYFHVPSAIAMGMLFIVTSALSLAYLLKADDRIDAAAATAAELAIVLGGIVLVTGPLWARKAWGTFWTWEPRLTLTLLTVFLYVGYLAVRGFAGEKRFARRVAAGLGLIGAPAWYLIHIAVERWGGSHPKDVVYGKSGGLENADMKTTFFMGLLATFLFVVVAFWTRYKVRRLTDRLDDLYLDMEANALSVED